LAGDAASVARPHTGGGAVKALQDALVLEDAWRKAESWDEVLTAYDADRAAMGSAMVRFGQRLGETHVVDTPDWATMTESELNVWWLEKNQA
jgi:2-polyprenyl-6-methoxyphenol hydroxylase-like FAD-dependent oxidoreductase